MISREQLNELAQSFSIDTFSVFREYLQLLFLSYFYREKAGARVFFKGGTALRLVFGSPRFSEDLDFSTTLEPSPLEGLLRDVFPVVLSLSAEEILAEKIRAFFCRGRGRDIFDLWFLSEKGARLKPSLVDKKLAAAGKTFSPLALKRKLEGFSAKDLALDLHPFLPAGYRPLTKTLISAVVGKLFPAKKW